MSDGDPSWTCRMRHRNWLPPPSGNSWSRSSPGAEVSAGSPTIAVGLQTLNRLDLGAPKPRTWLEFNGNRSRSLVWMARRSARSSRSLGRVCGPCGCHRAPSRTTRPPDRSLLEQDSKLRHKRGERKHRRSAGRDDDKRRNAPPADGAALPYSLESRPNPRVPSSRHHGVGSSRPACGIRIGRLVIQAPGDGLAREASS